MPARTKKKPAVTPEMITKAKKLKAEGKSYKAIATALGFKYDKAAWNILNSGPTGRHRGDKAGGKPSGTVPKGKRGAGKGKAAEGSVEARRTGRKSGKRGAVSPVEAPATPTQDKPSEEVSANTPGSLTHRFGQKDRPVARPAESNGADKKDEVRAVPKPGARKK